MIIANPIPWYDKVGGRREWLDRLQLALATPILEYVSSEFFEVNGEPWVRYYLRVNNWQDYDNSLFAAAPDLAPCGKNTNSARTWVDIFDDNNQRLYGFCALGQASDLQNLWVARPLAQPLNGVYIELLDRRANRSARSNIVAPPSLTIYEEVVRSVPQEEPLFFNPGIHGYIFGGFAGQAPTTQGLTMWPVYFDGRPHAYYQDAVHPNRFYYLPDAFKLLRNPENQGAPALKLEVTAGEPEQYRLTYVAVPYVNWDRLEAAELELQRHIPAGYVDPIALEPLQTSAVTFVPFQPALYMAGTVNSLNLTMLQGVVTLTRDDFTPVWDELNGTAALSLGGKLKVAVQGFPDQELQVILRLDDTVGELLSFDVTPDDAQGCYRLAIRNVVESPLQIKQLSPFVQSRARGPADIRLATWLELPLPADPLPPGGEFQARLAPPPGAPLADFIPLIDTDQVQVIPATELLLDAMIDGSVREYSRPVTMWLVSTAFTRGSRNAFAVQVSFVGGETIILSRPAAAGPTQVSGTVSVKYPNKRCVVGARGWGLV